MVLAVVAAATKVVAAATKVMVAVTVGDRRA